MNRHIAEPEHCAAGEAAKPSFEPGLASANKPLTALDLGQGSALQGSRLQHIRSIIVILHARSQIQIISAAHVLLEACDLIVSKVWSIPHSCGTLGVSPHLLGGFWVVGDESGSYITPS
jgi:hypothetical protein